MGSDNCLVGVSKVVLRFTICRFDVIETLNWLYFGKRQGSSRVRRFKIKVGSNGKVMQSSRSRNKGYLSATTLDLQTQD